MRNLSFLHQSSLKTSWIEILCVITYNAEFQTLIKIIGVAKKKFSSTFLIPFSLLIIIIRKLQNLTINTSYVKQSSNVQSLFATLRRSRILFWNRSNFKSLNCKRPFLIFNFVDFTCLARAIYPQSRWNRDGIIYTTKHLIWLNNFVCQVHTIICKLFKQVFFVMIDKPLETRFVIIRQNSWEQDCVYRVVNLGRKTTRSTSGDNRNLLLEKLTLTNDCI